MTEDFRTDVMLNVAKQVLDMLNECSEILGLGEEVPDRAYAIAEDPEIVLQFLNFSHAQCKSVLVQGVDRRVLEVYQRIEGLLAPYVGHMELN